MIEYIIVCLLSVLAEVGLIFWFNKREPEYSLDIKRYGIVIAVADIAIMVLAVLLYSESVFPVVWYFGICSYLMCLCIYDFKYKELPDWFHLVPLLIYLYLFIQKDLPYSIISGLITAFIVGMVLIVIFLIRKDAIGLGDIKVIVICSQYAGLAVVGVLIRGMIFAFLCSLVLLLFKKVNTKSGLPFVPFLLLGALFL